MQAWQYTTIKETLESSLTLNEKATPPDAQSLPPGHVLVEVITAAVNPVEYKLPEAPLYGSSWCNHLPAQASTSAVVSRR